MELLTQIEIIKELNSRLKSNVTKQAFHYRVKQGHIKIYEKPNSKKKYFDKTEVLSLYGISETSPKETLSEEDLSDLKSLLKGVTNPKVRVDIINKYWIGKLKRERFEKLNSDLIPLREVEGVMSVYLFNVSSLFKNIPKELENKGFAGEELLFAKKEIDEALDNFKTEKVALIKKLAKG